MINDRLAYKQQRYLQGLCVWCSNPRDTNRKLCKACRDRESASFKQKRDDRIAQGLCAICGIDDELLTTGTLICMSCWFKRIALAITGQQKDAPKLRELFFEQEGSVHIQTSN